MGVQERERYREPVRDAIKALLAIKWKIEYESEGVSTSGREQVHRQDTVRKSNVLLSLSLSLSPLSCYVQLFCMFFSSLM